MEAATVLITDARGVESHGVAEKNDLRSQSIALRGRYLVKAIAGSADASAHSNCYIRLTGVISEIGCILYTFCCFVL